MREKFYDEKGKEIGEVDMMNKNGKLSLSSIYEIG
jgi:hypothetical protein